MAGKPERPKRGDAATHIYEKLRSGILMMRLAPGLVIDEAAIVREFDVSRTPVREAIVRLAADGLVVLLPNKGSQVAPLDLAKVRNYLEAMDVIQPAVTALAARRRLPADLEAIRAACKAFDEATASGDNERQVLRNRDFHIAIASACGNDLLIASYQRLLDEGLRISPLSLSSRFATAAYEAQGFNAEISRQHWAMVEAIESQDADAAAKLADRHTEVTRHWFGGFLADSYKRAPNIGSERDGSPGL
jgi:DNA-binding GntR family transcriptional regulator